MTLTGQRLAVAGMGRSGVAIAQAALERGAQATVYDERPLDDAARIATADRLQGLGATVVAGWHGRLADEAFDLLVASPGFRREHPAIRDALAAGREVISEVEFAGRIAQAPVVAATGTNGKSTTVVLAWLLLGAHGCDAVLCGNLSGSGYPEITLTEAADRSGPDAVLVAEVSCYQLDWVSGFRPRVAAITNVTEDHLDRYDGFEDYYRTKLRIFGGQGEGDVAVVNVSEPSTPLVRVLPAIPPGVAVRSFGRAGEAPDVKGQPISFRTALDCPYLILSGRQVRMADLPFGGRHSATNAAMAWEMACAFAGEPDSAAFDAMLGALAGFRGLAHRMERLGERGGVLVVNNSMCTNPMAVIASSDELSRRQWLLMGGRNKDADVAPLRDFLAARDHRVLFFGSAVELEAPDSIATCLGLPAPRYATLEEAFAAAVTEARPGEAIVLSPGGASTGVYANFVERGDAFREIARRWLD
jgi:UDP-N-acetylmuramoylalanine--D-glutamate ligase